MINKNSPLPIYAQLEEQIREQIESGILGPGDTLPSEREFCERHGISRMTVRQAINNLAKAGYLRREKGRGTFVSERKMEQQLQGLTSFTEDMKARGRKPSSKLLHFEIVPAVESIAQTLSIPKHDPVYHIKRIRMADGEPMALETTHIPANLVPGLTPEIATGSIYNYLEEHLSIAIDYSNQVIESVTASETESHYLDIPSGSPILLMQRDTFLKDGTPVETVKSAYRADRYKFVTVIRR
ncbi:phosphonate metabolism transcriptional regulator PhnF [Melghirimyces algeriensis]|uniref:Transcriptional regulator, GntR family n=1 Tax=Melghirimyces algeriensis TaxID=910412 RepID=A0A521BZ65_9BACL|nr:phosphonate metabolism transcriptional regulator PhnF [Melghirimyces algeriensis]SMO52345.1 transcriptional regulator, GntR family [Melghirimyces algeriensis]